MNVLFFSKWLTIMLSVLRFRSAAVKNKKAIPHFTWILANQQNVNCFQGSTLHDTLILIPQFPFMEGFRNYFNDKDDAVEFNDVVESPGGQSSCLNIGTLDSPSERRKEEIQASMNSVYLLARAYEKVTQSLSLIHI